MLENLENHDNFGMCLMNLKTNNLWEHGVGHNLGYYHCLVSSVSWCHVMSRVPVLSIVMLQPNQSSARVL